MWQIPVSLEFRLSYYCYYYFCFCILEYYVPFMNYSQLVHCTVMYYMLMMLCIINDSNDSVSFFLLLLPPLSLYHRNWLILVYAYTKVCHTDLYWPYYIVSIRNEYGIEIQLDKIGTI